MEFETFLKKYKLENKATSNIKISEVINKLKIKDFDIYMRDDELTTKQGIINLGAKKGTHWVCYSGFQPSAQKGHYNNVPLVKEHYQNYYFDSFGVKPPKNIEKQLKPLIFSTYKIQDKKEKLCASYCLYILYLINLGLPFKEAVLKLFLQS